MSIDNRGAANYSIPLSIPPGRGALQPALSLSYNSGGGNGVLGLGFALSTGYPQAISRGRSILARDGTVRGATFDINDKFYLDGKRLILVSTDGKVYGQPGSVYRTEVDSFATITTAGIGTNASTWNIETFTLREKNGTRMTFGRLGDAWDAYHKGNYDVDVDELEEPGELDWRAHRYALKRVEDPIGNTIEFNYLRLADGEDELQSIIYTSNPSNSVAAKQAIRLYYNEQVVPGNPAQDTTRRDGSASYIAARRFPSTGRLDRIDAESSVSGAATVVARYSLSYQYAPSFGPTRLVSVASSFRESAAQSLAAVPPTVFEWSDHGPSYTTTGPTTGAASYSGYHDPHNPDHYAFGDVNGDGKDDCIWFGNTLSVQLSDGASLGAVVSWHTGNGLGANVWKLADVNGDGKKDVIAGRIDVLDGKLRLYCFVSTGSSFTPLSGTVPIYEQTGDFGNNGSGFVYLRGLEQGGLTSRIAVADFTGDGRDDVLIHRYDGKLKVLKNQGATFLPQEHTIIGVRAVEATMQLPSWYPVELLGYNLTNFSVSMIPCELNGDGIADYVWIESSSSNTLGTDIQVSESKNAFAVTSLPGGGFSPFEHLPGASWTLENEEILNGGWFHRQSNFVFMPGDVNGDGLTDFTFLQEDVALDAPRSGQYSHLQGYEMMFRHAVYLSKGASGKPMFHRLQPLAGLTVDVGGQQRYPWYDKVSYGVFESTFMTPTVVSIGDSLQRVVNYLGASNGDGISVCDVNLDGREDYVWYVAGGASAGWWTMYQIASGYSAPQPAPLGWIAPTEIAPSQDYLTVTRSSRAALDLNGDGIKDYAYANHYARESPGFVGFHRSAAPSGNRIVKVTNGLGRKTEIGYKPITDDSVYTPGAAVQYPIRELRSAQYVVSDVYKDAGSVNASQRAHFTYQYSGNRLDLSGRGSLGFHSFVTLDTQTKLFSYQFLAQSFPMTGLTAREQTYRYWTSGGNAYFRAISSQDSEVVFDEVATSEGRTVYPFISQSTQSRWEDSTTPHFTWEQAITPALKAELIFSSARPSGAHVTVSAQSWFDEQGLADPPVTSMPGGFFASDANGSANVLAAYADYTAFQALAFPRQITHGNLRQLKTDYGDSFTETVVTTYKPGATVDGHLTLTGRPDAIATTVTSTIGGTEYAPTKRYAYWGNTALPSSEEIDANRDGDAVDQLDLKTTYTRDTLGRVTNTEISGYNNPGNAQHVGPAYSVSETTAFDASFDLPTIVLNAAPYKHSATTVYHPLLGVPASVTDVNGVETATAYDPLGRALVVENKKLGLKTRTTFAWTTPSATGWTKTQSVAPPAGHTGVASGAPVTGVVAITVSSVYAIETRETLSASTTAYKPVVWTYYDRLGRVVRQVKETFNNGKAYSDTAYNSLGQAIAATAPYDPANATTGPFWTKTSYDALGRVATIVAPNGTVTMNAYIGRVTKVTVDAPSLGGVNPAPQANATLVDAKGRTVKVWNANNIPTTLDPIAGSADEASIQYVLDGFGRMRETILQGQTQKILATYDALGQQLSLNDPDKGPWSYVNNALGQVVQQTDARQNITRTTYDRLGRALKRETHEPSGGPVETATFHFYDVVADAATHRVALGAKGWIGAPQREESATAGALGYAAPLTAAVHYYDDKGRPSIDLSSVDGKWLYTVTAYDAASRVQSVRTYWRPPEHEAPGDNPYSWMDWGYAYIYDAKGYLTSVGDNDSRVWWSNPVYDHLDRLVSQRKGDAYYTQRVYRPQDGVLTAIKTGPTVGSTTVQNLSFNFDGLGNLTSRGDGANSETFGYDSLNRLVSRNGSTIADYEDNGNISWKKEVSGTQSAAYAYSATKPHAATSAWAYAMTYDASGNMLTRSGGGQTWSAKWAGFDKPRWLAKNATGSEFVYGASRDRVIHLEFDAMSGGAPSRYLRKKLYPLGKTVELDYVNTASSGQAWLLDTVRLYVPGPEGLLGAMEFSPSVPVGPPTKACVYHYDHLGSIQSVTDHADATLQRALDGVGKPSLYSYDPWGERRDPGDWLGKPSATADGGADDATPRGFTGHEMLDDLGLVHMNGRIYDPLLGRFLSADMVVPDPANLQFFNRYSYVGNNPLSMTDPTGYNPWANDSAGIRAMVQPLVPESPRGRATYGLIGNLLEAIGLGVAESATLGTATPAVVLGLGFVADDTAANLTQFVTNEDQRTIRGGAAHDVVTSLGGSETLANNVELAVNVGTTGATAGVIANAVAKTEGAVVQALADAKVQPKLATEVAESAPTAKTPKSRGYDRPEIETKSGKAVKDTDVTDDIDDFVGSEQTNIDPRDGLSDPDRIWSADGKRSVRYGDHEMDSKPTKHHYHKETWHDDEVENELQRIQKTK